MLLTIILLLLALCILYQIGKIFIIKLKIKMLHTYHATWYAVDKRKENELIDYIKCLNRPCRPWNFKLGNMISNPNRFLELYPTAKIVKEKLLTPANNMTFMEVYKMTRESIEEKI